ncbi:MAG: ATP-dependent zinc metalloprotease FtsH, partial [Candidatus Omnitrophica bacterium]|nr:ATP-dependent zinc metalloprotease FtsH [Candidatus Omnitrophota bacterium]
MTYSEFYRLVQENPKTQEIAEARLVDTMVEGRLSSGQIFRVFIPSQNDQLIQMLRENVSTFDVQPPQAGFLGILMAFAPWIVLLGIMWFVMRSAQGGGRLLSFGKSRARLVTPETGTRVTFDDVAGIDEAKEELREIIEFLKDPKRFQRLGGKIPKGVLLIGLPGTGKTLLAKAVAGEANVPFYSISGSDFVEMFVGVGASRVRDLFEQARRNARQGAKGAIVFIDEIDAVGRQRFAGIGGGHDEREQTLNALLVEMDGFDTQEGLILMAATNRPDVLDPALLRPGRFDRQVVISLPDIVGREAILKVHTRKIKLGKEVDLKSVARQTPGFSGADLANLANEAALLAARRNKEGVDTQEMEAAIERVIAGPERKTRVLNEREKKITAFHEAGHALVALMTPGTDPVHKVSIIPRGAHALGYTMQLPLEDRYTMSKQELTARMTVMMGGRAAEELVFSEITTGAQNDIETATELARRMVCEFGMSDRLGNLTYGRRERQ